MAFFTILLFLEAHSFLLGTDNVHGQISQRISSFTLDKDRTHEIPDNQMKWRLLFIYSVPDQQVIV